MSKKKINESAPKVDKIFLREIMDAYPNNIFDVNSLKGTYGSRNTSGYYFHYDTKSNSTEPIRKYMGTFTIKKRMYMGIFIYIKGKDPVESEVFPLGTYIEPENEYEQKDVEVVSLSYGIF